MILWVPVQDVLVEVETELFDSIVPAFGLLGQVSSTLNALHCTALHCHDPDFVRRAQQMPDCRVLSVTSLAPADSVADFQTRSAALATAPRLALDAVPPSTHSRSTHLFI